MVFVGEKKYACETCIKGHRSSTCKHTDRPLFEIKKKGRPVTQCEHCRELRKTKQVHVKCMCGAKDDADGPSGSGKGNTHLPASAAFPSGLPEGLEASVAPQVLSDGSDSDHGSIASCSCKDTGSCHCATPRIVRTKRAGKASARRTSYGSADAQMPPVKEEMSQPAALVVQAHSGGIYRPVLPKPSLVTGPTHDPSANNVHAARYPTHGQIHYSPYGRAYEQSHSPDYLEQSTVQYYSNDASSSAISSQPSSLPPWIPSLNITGPDGPSTSVLCGCGPSCACPGCADHRGRSADPMAPCNNPAVCMSCLDCAMVALPASLVPGTEAEIDAAQLQNIDAWLRDVSSTAPPEPSSAFQSQSPPPPQSPFDMRFDQNMLQTYALWGEMQGAPPHAAPGECCGGRCKCPAGLCACAADCCGCCAGCSCTTCAQGGSSNRTLTFAVSGERASCCGGPTAASPPFATTAGSVESTRGLEDGWSASLRVPRTGVSRASSSSSVSSFRSPASTPGSGQGDVPASVAGAASNPSSSGPRRMR